MSPWTVLGWIVVALIVVPIAARLLIGLVEIGSDAVSDVRRARRLRAANKGKVRCEFRDCPHVATRRGPSGFVCEDHIGTHLTRKSVGLGSTVSYAQMLDHAKGDAA